MDSRFSPNDILICPFSKKGLRLLSEHEISTINKKIANGELSFYPGVPVTTELTQAFSCSNYLYIYPIIDQVVMLKKETAIVPKNRIENPFHKTTQADIDKFNAEFGFGESLEKSGAKTVAPSERVKQEVLSKISRAGQVLLTANANSADEILNLTYGLKYDQMVHADHRLDRLKEVNEFLPSSTLKVLFDRTGLPFNEGSVDALVDLEAVDTLDKEGQERYYIELKRILDTEAVSVALFNNTKELKLKKNLNADIRAKKALKMVAPWKKVKLPRLYFIEADQAPEQIQTSVNVKKTKFSRQLG